MSIVRVGLSETKGYEEGYEAIFGKKESTETKDEKGQSEAKEQAEKKDEPKK